MLLLDQLDELDAGVGVGRLDTVVRQEVEVATGVGAVPDERQEQRGLLSRRRPERLLDRGPGLGDRRVDQQAPGSRVGAAPHLGVGHHRVQVHRRLGQERQGRQARALRADNQDSPIAGDLPIEDLCRGYPDPESTSYHFATETPQDHAQEPLDPGRGKGSSLGGKRVVTEYYPGTEEAHMNPTRQRGGASEPSLALGYMCKDAKLSCRGNSASLTPKPLASSVYVHVLEAPSPLKRLMSVTSRFPSSRPYFPPPSSTSQL